MLIAVALATMVGGVSLAQGGEGGVEKTTAQAQKEGCPDVGQGISYYRSTTWKWQRLMGTPKTKASRQEATVSCRYAHWVAKLWQKRSMKARRLYERWVDFRTIGMTWDWPTAVSRVQVIFPGTAAWQMNCSSGEGGHGRFVMNSQGSPAGGWMQFYSSTFYAFVDSARGYVKSHGFIVHPRAWSWTHPLGQALVSGYIRYVLGIRTAHSHWSPSADYLCE